MSLFTPSDLGISGQAKLPADSASKSDIFAENKRKSWHKDADTAARCDLSVERIALTSHVGIPVISLWKKSVKGKLLTDIKSDERMVELFATKMSDVISRVLGSYLSQGHWAICTTPRRRHLVNNFACSVTTKIAQNLSITYYEDVAHAKSKERVNAVYDLGVLPEEPNLIVFDDFVTTGSTINSMRNLLQPLGKNLVFFVGINNNM